MNFRRTVKNWSPLISIRARLNLFLNCPRRPVAKPATSSCARHRCEDLVRRANLPPRKEPEEALKATGQALLCFPFAICKEGRLAKEKQPDDEQHWQHVRQGVLEDVAEERWRMRFLLVGDSFDHEVRTIADVCVGSEEDRAHADGLK